VILVINPNLALDRVVATHFERGSTLRPIRASQWAGGSGTHAAYVASLLGVPVHVVGFAGGYTGAMISDRLREQSIPATLIPIEGETRQTFSLLDVNDGNICDVAEGGPTVTDADAESLIAAALTLLPQADLMILSGSLPEGCPDTLYPTLITTAASSSVPVFADLAGTHLQRAIELGVWMIKPSRQEAAQMAGLDTLDLRQAAELAKKWVQAGVENVCLSLDREGVLWMSSESAVQILPPSINAFNTIGCGDSLVGATAAEVASSKPIIESLQTGVAAAAANTAYDAPGYCTPEDVARLLPQVVVKSIH
jgi:1-phosphofructokinase family hexose kinase